MPQVFSPENDFLLPIGAFMERLLGDGIAPELREKAARIQAGLIVMEKHLPVPVELDAEAAKKFKQDALFKAIKEPEMLQADLEEIVPTEINIEKELVDARAVVDAGKGVPNVPAFGQIMSKFIPKDVVNLCLQAQAGLRIMAIINQWPGHEKIPEGRIFDNDPENLKITQDTLNKTREINLKYLDKPPEEVPVKVAYRASAALYPARGLGYNTILVAKFALNESGYEAAFDKLDQYTKGEESIENQYLMEELYAKFNEQFLAINPAPPPAGQTPKP
jgi:hypothetical protein